MKCPFCGSGENKVVDSRDSKEGMAIRRRRSCEACERRFTTYERVAELTPVLIKKDGRREPFDRAKVIAGLRRACEKRPVSTEDIESIADRVERALIERGEKEVTGREVGDLLMGHLRGLDEVAYVRFASVYRSFRDVAEFAEAARQVKKGTPEGNPRA